MITVLGDQKVIVLPAQNISAKEIYSQWKDWAVTGDNAKYEVAMLSSGGDALGQGLAAGSFFFVQNQLGWRIRPAEVDQQHIEITGNLVPQDPETMLFTPTLGDYHVEISLSTSPLTVASTASTRKTVIFWED